MVLHLFMADDGIIQEGWLHDWWALQDQGCLYFWAQGKPSPNAAACLLVLDVSINPFERYVALL